MLHQFSWTNFLVFFAVLSAIWYLALLLTVYRRDAVAFVSGSTNAPLAISAKESKVEVIDDSSAEEIMGKSKLPDGLAVVSMGALNFSVSGDSAYRAEDHKSDQLGLVPDVLQELKEIFAILEKEDGTKQDFFSLAGIISEKFGRIGSNPNIGKINEFIRDHAPFAVSLRELEDLWD